MVKPKKSSENAIPKTITLFPKHVRYIEEKSINLSKFVQKKIEEEIQTTNWKDKKEVSK